MTPPRARLIWIVGRREYLQRVRTRTFWITTFLTPAIMIAIFMLPMMLRGDGAHRIEVPPAQRMAIVSAALVVTLMVMALFISVLSWGVMVMRGVLEEKSSRVTELLLCSASADELMTGKILGIGAAGLTQVAVWVAIAAIAVADSPAARVALSGVHSGSAAAISFVIFYILGFLLYSSIFAAMGAAFNSVDEAQQYTFIALLPLLAATVLITPVLTAPHSTLALASSMMPFLSPVLMFARIAMVSVPAWQVLVCVLLLAITVAGAVVVCARIYRVGILMYGKRPTAREMMRWLRYS
jgi:ABC-2 type transport system permease protein